MLAEKMQNRADSVKEPKLKAPDVEPLESRRIREKLKPKAANTGFNNESVEKDNKPMTTAPNITVSNFNDYKPAKGEPSKDLIERLVYGKKATVRHIFFIS